MAINTKALQDLIKKIQDIPKKAINQSVARQTGTAMLAEMKDLISKGISPIEGKGRFQGYKRAGDPKGYPAKLRKKYPGKKNRPVNLKLSGDFLKDLTFRVSGRAGTTAIEVGYYTPSEAIKEEGHRDGANGQPSRPTIPEGKEQFAISIQEAGIEILEKAVLDYLKD